MRTFDDMLSKQLCYKMKKLEKNMKVGVKI